MEFVKFDIAHGKKLIDEEKLSELKAYIKRFFFKYRDKIFYFDGSNFILYEREQAMKLIPNDYTSTRMTANNTTHKFVKEETSFRNYLKETEFMQDEFNPTIDFSKPITFKKSTTLSGHQIEENFINMAKQSNENLTSIKANKTPDVQQLLGVIYSHIKEVLCSSNETLYQYTLNFFSATFGGRKLRKALLWQSSERTGKGQIINGLLNSILGKRMWKCNSTEQIVKYTKPFEGCALLNFDELPHCENYKGLQDTLKGLITEPTFICRDMFSTGYEQINTFNIIITSNNDSVSLTQTNNSRYVVSDISEHRVGDFKYFNELTKALNSDDVKRAFYEDMMDRFLSLDEWSEDIIPETENRNNKIIEALPMIYKYIKERFILTLIDIDRKTDEFLNEYRNTSKDKTSNQKIGRLLTKIGITSIKLSSNQGYKYKKTATELFEIYKKEKWIDDVVDVINPLSSSSTIVTHADNGIDEGIEKMDYKKNYEDALLEIEQLKKQLELNASSNDTLEAPCASELMSDDALSASSNDTDDDLNDIIDEML